MALRTVLVEADFVAIRTEGREPMPGERGPVITLRNAEGDIRKQRKWSNDKLEPFDKVHRALLDLQKKTQGLKADYEGPYQPDWTPASAPASQHAASQPATRPVDANTVVESGVVTTRS